MAFEIDGFRAFLAAQSAVTNIVGTRIYPAKLPQKPNYEAITYDRVSGVRLHHLGGVSGHATARISVSCWAATYTEAKALADAVREATDGYTGLMGTVTVRATHIENDFDLYEDDATGDGIYRVVQDYMIQHAE